MIMRITAHICHTEQKKQKNLKKGLTSAGERGINKPWSARSCRFNNKKLSAPAGGQPPGENSESCANHERYRRCMRGGSLETKVSHWVIYLGRLSEADEA